MGNPGIGLARGGLDRERDLGELAHRPVLETALEDVEVHIVERPRREAEVCVGLGDAGHALRLLHTGDDALLAQVARMRETEALPIEDADADTALAARDDVLDRAVLDLHGSGARFLEEDLPRADAAGAERIEPALDDGFVAHALAHLLNLSPRGRGPWARSDPLVARLSFQLPAHHDRGDADGRLRVRHRRALPVLAAGAGRVAEVGADHVDLAHQLRPPAHQRRTPQRLRELPVAAPVALGDLECEVPGNDVDLATAHLLHEDAVLHRAHDLRGIRRARRDHRVRHPADRQEGKGPPAPLPRSAVA